MDTHLVRTISIIAIDQATRHFRRRDSLLEFRGLTKDRDSNLRFAEMRLKKYHTFEANNDGNGATPARERHRTMLAKISRARSRKSKRDLSSSRGRHGSKSAKREARSMGLRDPQRSIPSAD